MTSFSIVRTWWIMKLSFSILSHFLFVCLLLLFPSCLFCRSFDATELLDMKGVPKPLKWNIIFGATNRKIIEWNKSINGTRGGCHKSCRCIKARIVVPSLRLCEIDCEVDTRNCRNWLNVAVGIFANTRTANQIIRYQTGNNDCLDRQSTSVNQRTYRHMVRRT